MDLTNELPPTRPSSAAGDEEEQTDGNVQAILKRARGMTKKDETMQELTQALHVAAENRIFKLNEIVPDNDVFKLKGVDMNKESKFGTPILTIEYKNKLSKVWGTSVFKKALEEPKFKDVMNRKNFSYMTIKIGDGSSQNSNKMYVIDLKC